MQKQPAVSRHKSRREVLARQRASGLSIHRFCLKEGLATATFFGWQRRLRQVVGGGQTRDTTVNFAPVRIVPEAGIAAGAGVIEIWLPPDRRLRLTGMVDRQQLAMVLAALGPQEGE